MTEMKTGQYKLYLRNLAGAIIIQYTENVKIEAKWSKKDSNVYEVELRNISENRDAEGGDVQFELVTKYSSTTIEKLPDNKYTVTLTAWCPVTVLTKYRVKKLLIPTPELTTVFHIPLPKKVLDNLGINEFIDDEITIFDDIVLSYSIRRETTNKYVMDITSEKYNLNSTKVLPHKQMESTSFCPEYIEFEYQKSEFTKPPSKFEKSTVTFWLEQNDRNFNHKISISDQGMELDAEKVRQLGVEKFGAPDFDIKTADNVVIPVHKKAFESKVWKAIFEEGRNEIFYDSNVFNHVLAFVYGNSLEFHGLEFELIKFAKNFEIDDLMTKCIDSLHHQFDEKNICKIIKFAAENGISALSQKSTTFYRQLSYYGYRRVAKEDLKTLTCDMLSNLG